MAPVTQNLFEGRWVLTAIMSAPGVQVYEKLLYIIITSVVSFFFVNWIKCMTERIDLNHEKARSIVRNKIVTVSRLPSLQL